MTRTYTARPVWTWKCDRCGRESDLARSQSGTNGLPAPDAMRERGWYVAEVFGDLCPECAAASGWRDRQGDVWFEGADGLMHARETRPFPREHVEKKWGPLVPVTDVSETTPRRNRDGAASDVLADATDSIAYPRQGDPDTQVSGSGVGGTEQARPHE